jgi:hypothetical protein
VGLLLLLLACLLGCRKEHTWSGYAYPNRNDLTQHLEVGAFTSLEDCRQAAHAVLRRHHESTCRGDACDEDPLARGDYECGLDCKPRNGINVCKETLR